MKSITIIGAIKSTRTNSETGERTITLSLPKTEAGKVAELSLYDQIVFKIQFTPEDVAAEEGSF